MPDMVTSVLWRDLDLEGVTMLDEQDLAHLRRCVAVSSGDRTRHPEFEIARWAAANLAPGQRAAATVYTSGEHCPMCAAAHAWVGLGRIVYAASSRQLTGWRDEMGLPGGPVRPLSIQEIAPGITVDGPAPELTTEIRSLHFRFHGKSAPA